MGSQEEAVKEVLGILESADIPYMIVGSYAAAFHGLSRATHDLDIVVALSADSLPLLLDKLGDRFYWDFDASQRAVEQSDMFNAIHHDSGLKVDFWVLAHEKFAETQFSRRERADFDGVVCWVASTEDTILSKLLWHSLSGSERQLSDIRSMLAVSGAKMDYEYLRNWANELGLHDSLELVIKS